MVAVVLLTLELDHNFGSEEGHKCFPSGREAKVEYRGRNDIERRTRQGELSSKTRVWDRFVRLAPAEVESLRLTRSYNAQRNHGCPLQMKKIR
jgi:hypothetical protein